MREICFCDIRFFDKLTKNSNAMMYHRKFESAARSRRAFAFWAAIGLHLALLAAVLFFTDSLQYLLELADHIFKSGTVENVP